MRIALIQEDTEVRDKLVFMIESGFGAVVETFAHFDKLSKKPVGGDQRFDLFIFDSVSGKSGDFANALKLFVTLSPDAPVIEITKDIVVTRPEGKVAAKATEKFVRIGPDELTARLSVAIDDWVDQGIIRETSAPESRCRIRTKILLSVSPLKGDIYIRLSESKFVKLFSQGDVFDRSDLEKYAEKKGVQYLYIKHNECALFAAKYKEDLEKLLKTPTTSLAQVILSAETVHETVQSLVRTIGFTPEVQEIVKTQVALTMKAIEGNLTLSDLLAKLKGNQGRYLSAHSHLAAYFACALAAQLKWGSEQTFVKLNLACFIHDITLENHALAAEKSVNEVQLNKTYSAEEVKAFQDHARHAAGLVSNFTEVPPDVDTIVAQHHELPDGTGFPQGLNHTRIAPLTAIFIVAHDMAQWAMAHGFEFDGEQFLARNGEKYVGSQFKKIVAALQAMADFKSGGAAKAA